MTHLTKVRLEKTLNDPLAKTKTSGMKNNLDVGLETQIFDPVYDNSRNLNQQETLSLASFSAQSNI